MTDGNINLDHLRPDVRQYALASDYIRIRQIRAERFIPFKQIVRALGEAERLLGWPDRVGMPNLLISADSGMGKSTLVTKFRRDHPPGMHDEQGVLLQPIVTLEIPSPDEARIYTHLLEGLNAPILPRESIPQLEIRALRLLKQIRPSLVILDEFHKILQGNYRKQRAALGLVRLISNQVRSPIVAFGTDEALTALSVDPQIQSRFSTHTIAPWQLDTEFRTFVMSLLSALPLQRASPLDEPATLKGLLNRSRSNTRTLVKIIERAAEDAVLSGTERIDAPLLEASARALGIEK
ncbi:TniB family NTP-binding protein [Belnapia moabensis]|uniref:TniB family NTP-binding protein n=1 Tax=Belnapia moabensis TaxID=365533 RepID=UPI00147028CB|nr:TniB family NTP-binding protein [Belnapia moabensis]